MKRILVAKNIEKIVHEEHDHDPLLNEKHALNIISDIRSLLASKAPPDAVFLHGSFATPYARALSRVFPLEKIISEPYINAAEAGEKLTLLREQYDHVYDLPLDPTFMHLYNSTNHVT